MVLVVDDEVQIRQLVADALRLAGYAVTTAANADEALDILRAGQMGIRLVLTDVQMPGMSGVELADVIRAEFPGLKVAMMSGYVGAHGPLPPARDPNRSVFIAKPFTIAGLHESIRQALGTH